MTKKVLALAWACMAIAAIAHAQQGSTPLWVVSAAGGEQAVGDMTISWTLGEPGVGTLEAGGLMLTGGFQQGNIVFVKEAETGLADNRYDAAQLLDVSLFPNPTSSAFRVLLSASGLEGGAVSTTIEIVDVAGRMVRAETAMLSPGQPYTVSVEPLRPGVYLVRLRTADRARVVKLVKE
ncbi:MAG: T9SS type A sorting domain-containing protein [Bacteroidales bacterium]|nr:T9SS type A sorting domain-containing protein [Bacteroidales bacterium]